ncbi:MAG: hypothetical protein U0269_15775 [Polyangiales bacterium]
MQPRSTFTAALTASALVTALATAARAQDAGVARPTAPPLGLDDGYLDTAPATGIADAQADQRG